MCKGKKYGVLGRRQINTCRKFLLQVNVFRWRHFELPSMSLIFLGVKTVNKWQAEGTENVVIINCLICHLFSKSNISLCLLDPMLHMQYLLVQYIHTFSFDLVLCTTVYSTLHLYLLSLKFPTFGWCWDRTLDCCSVYGIYQWPMPFSYHSACLVYDSRMFYIQYKKRGNILIQLLLLKC